jgi:putative pyruvate formate lyase activating enzyme
MGDDEHNRFIVAAAPPRYLDADARRALTDRARAAVEQLADCRICPRQCGTNRLTDANGVCQTGRYARVSSAFPHFGEEDCLRGTRGSGTIFFASCNLRCVFCQNWDISQRRGAGVEMGPDHLARLMLDLQEHGCHNVNLVTPTHVVPQIVEALIPAVEGGLRLPIVYNTGGYDTVDSLRLLEGLVDVYMPDFKFWSAETARQLANAPDYPDRARDAIREMHRQVGDLHFTGDGIAQRGLLIRHLVMPGQLEESRQIFHWLARAISPDTFVNIMGQYRPEHHVNANRYPDINRRPSRAEMKDTYAAAREAGLWRFDERAPSLWSL